MAAVTTDTSADHLWLAVSFGDCRRGQESRARTSERGALSLGREPYTPAASTVLVEFVLLALLGGVEDQLEPVCDLRGLRCHPQTCVRARERRKKLALIEYSPYNFPLEGNPSNLLILKMVGMGRFELPTPRTPSECSTRLSHIPTVSGAGAPKGYIDFNTASGPAEWKTRAMMPAFCICAPGRAHSLGGESPLHTRQGEVLAERQGCPSRGGIWRKL